VQRRHRSLWRYQQQVLKRPRPCPSTMFFSMSLSRNRPSRSPANPASMQVNSKTAGGTTGVRGPTAPRVVVRDGRVAKELWRYSHDTGALSAMEPPRTSTTAMKLIVRWTAAGAFGVIGATARHRVTVVHDREVSPSKCRTTASGSHATWQKAFRWRTVAPAHVHGTAHGQTGPNGVSAQQPVLVE